jgi:outer membrane protein, multidrug efflux system
VHLAAVAWIGSVAPAAALTLALAGCATNGLPLGKGPDLAVPPAWSTAPADGVAAAAATPLAHWWRRFQDPLLNQLVDQALQANTRIGTAQAALRQARAQRDLAAAALGPRLDGSASAQRSASGDQRATNALRVGLDAGWSPDLSGGLRQAVTAAEAAAEASGATLGDLQASIAAEVALAYITLRSGQARLAIADDNLASQLNTLQITEWRLQAGLVSALDAQQARAAAEQTRALRPALQGAIEQSRHALALLCGQAPAALDGVLQPTGALPRAADDLLLALPADMLRQRADVRAAEWQWQAATARVAVADAARRPSLSPGGTLGLGAATIGALTDGASVIRSLLASVAWPLLDGGGARAQVRSQQAALDQAREAWRASMLVALQEVEDTLTLLRAGRERTLHLDQAARAAAQAARLAQQSYQSGLLDYQRVLETQRNQLATQDNLASAQADLSADQVRLMLALGGGWDGGRLAASTSQPGTPP